MCELAKSRDNGLEHADEKRYTGTRFKRMTSGGARFNVFRRVLLQIACKQEPDQLIECRLCRTILLCGVRHVADTSQPGDDVKMRHGKLRQIKT